MFSVYAPDKQSVQVDIRPLLALPPVVQLALFDIFQHRLGGRVLGDDVEEQGAPADHDLVLAEMLGELELCFGSGGGFMSAGRLCAQGKAADQGGMS